MTKKLTFLILFFLLNTASIVAQVNVTFELDMTGETVSANGVHIAGSLNGWSPSATELSDPDGDGIYSVTLALNSGDFHEFKYINGNDWPGQETPCDMCSNNTNRYLYVPFEDVTIPTVTLDNCATEGVSNVTFRVDMSGETIDPDGVHLVGYVNGWNPGSLEMNLASANIYTVTKQYRIGEYLEYKFVNDNDWPGVETPGSDCQISSNRFLMVPAEDVELVAIPFNGCDGTSITFRVDLGSEIISPDGIQITGNFNNWNPGNVPMTNSVGSIYTKTFIFPNEGDIEYKFVNGKDFSVAETPGMPCSVSTNRHLTVGATDQTLDIINFGGCSFDYLIYESGSWSNISGPGTTDNVSIEDTYTNAGFECGDLFVNSSITPSGTIPIVVNGNLRNEGTIEIPSGNALVTMGGISGEGDFIIHKNTRFSKSTGRYSMVGSPITTGSSSDLGSLVYQYNETTPYGTNDGSNRFEAVGDGVALTPGKGYFSAFTGAIVFNGTPNNGNVSIPITYTSGSNAGFNLLSNPYPAAINASDFIADNDDITGTLYIWDDNGSDTERGSNNDYLTINEFGAAGNITPAGNQGNWDGFIRSGQGFFVVSKPAGGNVIFKNDMKSSTNNTDGGFFRNNEALQLRVILSNSVSISDALVGFTEKATPNEDRGLDSKKYFTGNELSVYSLLDDAPYSIQVLPNTQEQSIIRFGYSVEKTGNYQLIIENDLFSEFKVVQLYDSFENTLIDLVPGKNEIGFTTIAGEFDDRFSILADKINVVTSLDFNTEIYPFTATIYSIKGELLREVVFENQNQQNLLNGLENQLLIMKTSNSDQKRKIWIQK